MRMRFLGGPLLLAFLVAGCIEDPIRPEALPGQYSLVTAGDLDLPQVLAASAACDEWLVAGTLTLNAGGTYALALQIQTDCRRSGGPLTNGERTSSGTWGADGRDVTLTAGSGSLSAERLSGSRVTSGILLVVPDLSVAGDLTLRFTRAATPSA